MNVLSLFSGAGGLDLGLELAGFHTAGCVELDERCRETLAANTDWPIARNGDVAALGAEQLRHEFGLRRGELTLLAGGPPCQPFSKSGQWVRGAPSRMRDPRAQTLHAYLDAVEMMLPRVVLLENVKGFAAADRGRPDEVRALDVLFGGLSRINDRHGTSYKPKLLVVNAVDFGVPQKRERVIVVAERDGKEMLDLSPTHGEAAAMGAPRWANAWDAIGDLQNQTSDPKLRMTGQWAALLPTIPEGKNYLHHTSRGDGADLFGWRTKYWSFLLKLSKSLPSWTIQAQPGPATGPFHWSNRQLSVRELARLQTFPDRHTFLGGYGAARKQIGNAVPVGLGEKLGLEIVHQLLDGGPPKQLRSIPQLRDDLPPPEPPQQKVPTEYRRLVGQHRAHPGTGLGPRALGQSTERFGAPSHT